MFPSPFNTKRLIFNEDSISKQEQSTPNASQAEITLPLVKKSNPDELVSWIDSLESRVKDTLRHQNNELKQFNVEHEREKAKDKYRYAVFEQSFQKLGNIVQNNRLDSDAESTTEANKMNIDEIDESNSKVGGEYQGYRNVSEDKSDIEENVVSDDSDIIEIIESEEEGDQQEIEQEMEQEIEQETEQETEQENEEDLLFDEMNPQPSYSKPRLMDDRKYMSGPFSSYTKEPEEHEYESEIESENEVIESEVEDESNEEVSVSDRENDSDEMVEVQHSADTYGEPENHQENEDFQDEEQNPSFHSYHANAMEVDFLHNPHEPERCEAPAAHTNHDLNNYFTSEYNHAEIEADADVDAEIHDYGSVYTHKDLPSNSQANSHKHDDAEVSVMVEEISSTLENENDDNNDDDNMHDSDAGSDVESDAGSDGDEEEEEEEESENDHEVSEQMDNAPLEKSVLESIASFMTNANNVHKNDTFEPESINTNPDEHKEETHESETNSHLDEQDNTAMNLESETLLQNEEIQENTAIESESEEESNSPPPLIFRTLLEHEPEEVLDQLKETEKRFNIKLNVVSAMEEELPRVPGPQTPPRQNAGRGDEDADEQMAAAIQKAIESSQTNAGEEYQADSELEAIQNNEIQAVLDSVEHQIGREEREEAEETAGEVVEHVSEVPLPHIEKPILEAVPPGPEETYIDATTEIDAEVDDTEKTSLPNVDEKSEHEMTDILGSESENNERVSILKGPSIDGNELENKTTRDLESPSKNNDTSTLPEDTSSLHDNALGEDSSRNSQSQGIEKRSFSEDTQPVDDAISKIESSSILQSPSEHRETPAGEFNSMNEASRSQSEDTDDKPTIQFQLVSEDESNTLQSQTENEDTLTERVEHLETENTNTFEAQPDQIEVTDDIRLDEEENSASIIPQSAELDVEMEEVNNDSPSENVDSETKMEEEAVQKEAEDMAEELVGEVLSNEQQFSHESSAIDENVQMENGTITHETEPTSPVPTEGHEEQLESNDLSIERNEVDNDVESKVEFEVENYVEIEVENEPEVENHEQSEENEEVNGSEIEEEIEHELVVESKLEYQVENDVEDIVQTEHENETELAVKNDVESEIKNEENEVNDTQNEAESKVDYEVESDVDNNVKSNVENEVENTDEVENEIDELETEAGEKSDPGKIVPESSASVTVQGIVAGDEGLKYVEIEETVTEVQEVLYPSAVLEPFEEEPAKENVTLDRLEAEEYFSNDDDEEKVAVALPSVIIEEGEEVLVRENSEQSDENSFTQEEEIKDEALASSDEKDNHGKSLEGEAKDEINQSSTDQLETEPEHTSGRKRHFEEVEEEEDKHLAGSTFKRFRTFVSSFFGKKREPSSNQAEDISVPRISPPTLSPVESETEVEEDSEGPELPINTEDETEDRDAFVESEENDERSSSNSDAGANNEVNDSEAETEVSDEENLKERKNRFDVQEDLESVPTVEAIQTLKKRHPRMLQGLDISEEMLQPSHSLRNGHTYGKPGSLESTPEEPKLRIPKRGMRRQNVPKLIDTSIRPDEDYPAFRTRSKSPLKRSLQEIISTEEDVIAPRRRSRRVAQQKMKAPDNENDGMDDGK